VLSLSEGWTVHLALLVQLQTQGFAMLLFRGALAHAEARRRSRPRSRRSIPKSAEESQELRFK